MLLLYSGLKFQQRPLGIGKLAQIHTYDSAEACAAALKGLAGGRRAFAIIDSAMTGSAAIGTEAGSADTGLWSDIFGDNVIWLEADEGLKSLACVEALARTMLEKGVDREWLLVGIGGGITTDITGLLAAIYMRGIACGLVPTTLLAQVDAAIGGKNGVNLDGSKNILGTFREPEFICICPDLTQTLNVAERLCGIAEILKAFILSGQWDKYRSAAALWSQTGQQKPIQASWISQEKPDQPSTAAATEAELIRAAIDIKQDIVARDPLEKGERRLLNLGHTFGHAIEKCSGGTVPHGLAVAAGIILSARASTALGLLDSATLEQLRRDFQAIGLPTGTDIAPDKLIEAMRNDKKKSGEAVRFVLPTDSSAVIKAMRPEEMKDIIGGKAWD